MLLLLAGCGQSQRPSEDPARGDGGLHPDSGGRRLPSRHSGENDAAADAATPGGHDGAVADAGQRAATNASLDAALDAALVEDEEDAGSSGGVDAAIDEDDDAGALDDAATSDAGEDGPTTSKQPCGPRSRSTMRRTVVRSASWC